MSFFTRCVNVITIALCGVVVVAAEAADVREVWSRFYNRPPIHGDEAVACAVDADGSIVVVGSAYSGTTNYDIAVVKYAPDGTLEWDEFYAQPGTSSDFAADVVVDASGNAYVLGTLQDGVNRLLVLLKYSPAGALLWDETYDMGTSCGAVYDILPSLELTADSHLVVGWQKDCTYLVLKYDLNGTLVWHHLLTPAEDPIANVENVTSDIAVAPDGSIYLIGIDQGGGTGFTLLKFTSAGDFVWARQDVGPLGQGVLGPAYVECDSDGNACIASTPESTFGIHIGMFWKYAPDGTRLWLETWTPSKFQGVEVRGVGVDSEGNLLSGGNTGLGEQHPFAIKLSPTGDVQWAEQEDVTPALSESATAMTSDEHGNTYVTAFAYVSSTNLDAVTVKWNGDGEVQWSAVYEGVADGSQRPIDIVVGPLGRVYVVGYGWNPPNHNDFMTLKYAQTAKSDMNCDGLIDGRDVSAFALAMLDAAAYTTTYNECDIDSADLNDDMAIDVGDVAAFVTALLDQ